MKTVIQQVLVATLLSIVLPSCNKNNDEPLPTPTLPSNSINIKTSKSINKMDLIIKGKGCFIDVNGNAIKDNGEEVSDNSSTLKTVSLQSPSLNIYGDVIEAFTCSNQSLNSLDITHCPSIQALNCNSNELTSLDVSKNVNLRLLTVSNNRIRGTEMKNMLNGLVELSLSDEAVIWIINNGVVSERNIATSSDITIAKNKRWKVMEVSSNTEYNGLSFSDITLAMIEREEATFTTNSIPISDEAGIKCKVGDIFLYKTNKGKFGKMEILSINKAENYKLTFRVKTFHNGNEIEVLTSNGLIVRGTYPCNLDSPLHEFGEITDLDNFGLSDFKNERQTTTNTIISPENGAKFIKYSL